MAENSKSDLILIPGLSDDCALWSHQVHHLADVAKPWVADISKPESVTAMAAEVLANAAPQFSLCGFSLGGYVAFEIYRQAPDRVVRLALVGTNARADTDSRRAERESLLSAIETAAGYYQVLTCQMEGSVAPRN